MKLRRWKRRTCLIGSRGSETRDGHGPGGACGRSAPSGLKVKLATPVDHREASVHPLVLRQPAPPDAPASAVSNLCFGESGSRRATHLLRINAHQELTECIEYRPVFEHYVYRRHFCIL